MQFYIYQSSRWTNGGFISSAKYQLCLKCVWCTRFLQNFAVLKFANRIGIDVSSLFILCNGSVCFMCTRVTFLNISCDLGFWTYTNFSKMYDCVWIRRSLFVNNKTICVGPSLCTCETCWRILSNYVKSHRNRSWHRSNLTSTWIIYT